MDQNLTPQTFFEKYVGVNLHDYVSIINAPTEDKPFNKTYTVEMLGNVVGGKEVKYLNVEMVLSKICWKKANLFGLVVMSDNLQHVTQELWH